VFKNNENIRILNKINSEPTVFSEKEIKDDSKVPFALGLILPFFEIILFFTLFFLTSYLVTFLVILIPIFIGFILGLTKILRLGSFPGKHRTLILVTAIFEMVLGGTIISFGLNLGCLVIFNIKD
jgi:hypothetical protein